jgi:hypothetical protein
VCVRVRKEGREEDDPGVWDKKKKNSGARQ